MGKEWKHKEDMGKKLPKLNEYGEHRVVLG
jgi:hypothetical protein